MSENYSSSGYWNRIETWDARRYQCGHCGSKVSSEKMYKYSELPDGGGFVLAKIYICPECEKPTYFSYQDDQIPGFPFGNPVNNVPTDINSLFEEARNCTQNNCFTSAVLISRKILMNIAVREGAKEKSSFLDYVNFLSEKGYVPPNGNQWVDYIRKKGNEANHEIKIMSSDDAQKLIIFLEMLLKFIYEFPNLIQTTDDVNEK